MLLCLKNHLFQIEQFLTEHVAAKPEKVLIKRERLDESAAAAADFNSMKEEEPETDDEVKFIYSLGELVIARCTGYPWWPGMIMRIPTRMDPEKYQVMFFDDTSTSLAFVRQHQIKAFVKSCPNKPKATAKQVSLKTINLKKNLKELYLTFKKKLNRMPVY